MLRHFVCVLIFAVCLHGTQSDLAQPRENASQRWSRVSHKYQRLYRASYYSVHTEVLTWSEASNVCAQEGAHLLIINSQEEADAIKRLLDPSVPSYHAGFHDQFEETNFQTVQCQTLQQAGYTKWAVLEPSSFFGENCGGIDSNVLLYDLSCTVTHPFVCEYEPN